MTSAEGKHIKDQYIYRSLCQTKCHPPRGRIIGRWSWWTIDRCKSMIFMRTERTWHGIGGCKYVPALCSIVSIDSSYGMRDCRGCNCALNLNHSCTFLLPSDTWVEKEVEEIYFMWYRPSQIILPPWQAPFVSIHFALSLYKQARDILEHGIISIDCMICAWYWLHTA